MHHSRTSSFPLSRVLLSALFFAGCYSSTYSREEAMEMGGVTPEGEDICELAGWYGDGECDVFCPSPDPDCSCLAPGCGECRPLDARGEGACERALGFTFDGEACVFLSGCSCAGADCAQLTEDEESCLNRYGHCIEEEPPPLCDPAPGDPGVFFLEEDLSLCATLDYLCDDEQVAFENACGCGCRTVNYPCAADDVRGVGACRAIVGYAFDGAQCVMVSGCSCEGEDCGKYDSIEECERLNASCLPDEPSQCEPDQARGTGFCAAEVGIVFDGRSCVSISGCSCDGPDCGRYSSFEECVRLHAGCGEIPADCTPQDARLSGMSEHDAHQEVIFTGYSCVIELGLECHGSECGEYATLEECEAENWACLSGDPD